MQGCRGLSILFLLLSLCSCHRLVQQDKSEAAVPAFRRPTTPAELLYDQSKCTELGHQIMPQNINMAYNSMAVTQEQVSRYNPKDNRCYVRVFVYTANSSASQENFISNTYLFDGQSRGMLAYVNREGQKKKGMVFDSSLLTLMQEEKKSNTDIDAVGELIDNLVETERRQ